MQFTKDWTTQFTASWRAILAPLAGKPILGVEIGCYEGRSTTWFMQNIFTNPLAHLICVDPDWDKAAGERFKANIASSNFSNKVTKHISDSWPFLSRLSVPVDFVYIDGNHEGRFVPGRRCSGRSCPEGRRDPVIRRLRAAEEARTAKHPEAGDRRLPTALQRLR